MRQTRLMRRLPMWAWLVGLFGLALVVSGAFLNDGSYRQAVTLQIGSVALLLVPIVFIERNIEKSLEEKIEDTVAIEQTARFEQLGEMWRDFGQALDKEKLPTVSPDRMLRMLGADGWRESRRTGGHVVVTKEDVRIAIPESFDELARGVVRGVMRKAGWHRERFDRLYESTAGGR